MVMKMAKRGRPRLGEKLSVKKYFRLPEDVAAAIEKDAKEKGITTSQWYRQALVRKLKQLGLL